MTAKFKNTRFIFSKELLLSDKNRDLINSVG